jgi:flagellum-specific ATP synthase
MERGIAERGRYPAVNVLKTVSRTMPRSTDPQFVETVRKAKQIMATFADMEELIRLGAYRQGSSPEVDEAIRLNPAFEAFLRQGKEEFTSLRDGYLRLAEILSGRAA